MLSAGEVDDLVRCYRTGDSTYDLARRFGIRRDTVSDHLRRRGVLRRVNNAVVLDDEQQQAVVRLYNGGASMRKIRGRPD